MITYYQQKVKSKKPKNRTLSILNNLIRAQMYTLLINSSNIAFSSKKCYNLTDYCDWRPRFMLHIYTGKGKGKTTASVGLAVRAAGSGLRVCFFQLMKDGSSSEIAMLEKLGIKVKASRNCCKFSFKMTDSEKEAAKIEHNTILSEVETIIKNNEADLIILDELFCALSANLLDKDLAERIILKTSTNIEIVLTGRGACSPFTDQADYITEMNPIKHPFDKGIHARQGIEY